MPVVMPASNRRRTIRTRVAMTVAVAAGGLFALAVPDAPAVAAPPVTVTVTSTGADNPRYRIDVRNETGATVQTTLRQELPPGAAPISISDGGRAATPPGQTNGTEISWQLELVAGGAATVHTELAPPAADVPVTAAACAFAGEGTLPYDCASATWQSATAAALASGPTWWRRTPALLAGLAVLLLIAVGAASWAWWRRRRELRQRADRASRARGAGQGSGGPGRAAATGSPSGSADGSGEGTPGRPAGRRIGRPASGGAVYRAGSFGGPQLVHDEPPAEPIGAAGAGGAGGVRGAGGSGGNLVGGWWQPAAPPEPPRRWRPPTWVAVALAAVLAAGLAATVIATASTQVTAMSADQQPSSGAWVGRTTTGQVGAPLRDSVFEFTVYRLACPDPAAGTDPAAGGDAGGAAGSRNRCQVTLGLRNLSGHNQHWDGALQRAYLPGGDWVTADETATLAANAGRDYFAQPVPSGERIVFPLVFTLPEEATPTRIELRSEVFSAGVSVDVPR